MDIYDLILENLELERELGTRTVEIDRALLVPPKAEEPIHASESVATTQKVKDEARPGAVQVAEVPVKPAAGQADGVEPRPAGKGEACADVCDIAFFTGRPLSERGMDAMRKTFAAMRKIRPEISIRLNERCRSKVIILLGSDALLKRQPTARPVRGAWIAIDGIPSIMTYSPDFIFGHFQENSPRMNKAKLDMWNDVKSAVARL